MRERRRRVAHSDETMLSFLSPEDLCIVKLIYNRDKETTDLERLFAVRQDLEIDYVRRRITDIVGALEARTPLAWLVNSMTAILSRDLQLSFRSVSAIEEVAL